MKTAFQDWVADAITQCGGDPDWYLLYSCGLPSKEVLTPMVDGLQHMSSPVTFYNNQALSWSSAVALTNLQTLH